jgi:hypothetical protein
MIAPSTAPLASSVYLAPIKRQSSSARLRNRANQRLKYSSSAFSSLNAQQ